MKRSGKSNEQVQKFPKTASPTADSRAVVVNKTQAQVDELSLITRNQEELVDELSLITRRRLALRVTTWLTGSSNK